MPCAGFLTGRAPARSCVATFREPGKENGDPVCTRSLASPPPCKKHSKASHTHPNIHQPRWTRRWKRLSSRSAINPLEGLRRATGPRANQYDLQHHETLQAPGLATARSTHTMPHVSENLWCKGVFFPFAERVKADLMAPQVARICIKYQCLVPCLQRQREPLERPEPMTRWQVDFTDIPTLPGEERRLAWLMPQRGCGGLRASRLGSGDSVALGRPELAPA
jgi:hypothetical protein